MSVVFRSAVATDVPQIIELVKASWARTYDPIIGVEARKAKSDSKHVPSLFLGEIERDDAASVVALSDEIMVGHVGGYLRPTSGNARTFFVDHLHVDLNFHGKNIATGLMDTLASEVNEIADCIELTVLENNPRALGFYNKHGFAEATGDNEDDGLGGVPSVLMRWKLR